MPSSSAAFASSFVTLTSWGLGGGVTARVVVGDDDVGGGHHHRRAQHLGRPDDAGEAVPLVDHALARRRGCGGPAGARAPAPGRASPSPAPAGAAPSSRRGQVAGASAVASRGSKSRPRSARPARPGRGGSCAAPPAGRPCARPSCRHLHGQLLPRRADAVLVVGRAGLVAAEAVAAVAAGRPLVGGVARDPPRDGVLPAAGALAVVAALVAPAASCARVTGWPSGPSDSAT